MPIRSSIRPMITVLGIGGAGGSAVNNMIAAGFAGVDFVVANTDAQALHESSAERRIQLGARLTEGLGAGAQPDVGRASAEESLEEVLRELSGSHMVFIAAGMGGGTGTGAAPVIARALHEQGILTIGVVTKPFEFEGDKRMRVALRGVAELQRCVDTLIVIPNENLLCAPNEPTTFAQAFSMADQVMLAGVRSVTDLIMSPGIINLDFADIKSVISGMGIATMGIGEATGEDRALVAAEEAISNPLLGDTAMKGARAALINITGGRDLTLSEIEQAANRIRAEIDPGANFVFGHTILDDMNGRIRVSIVVTGIPSDATADFESESVWESPAFLPKGTDGPPTELTAGISPDLAVGVDYGTATTSVAIAGIPSGAATAFGPKSEWDTPAFLRRNIDAPCTDMHQPGTPASVAAVELGGRVMGPQPLKSLSPGDMAEQAQHKRGRARSAAREARQTDEVDVSAFAPETATAGAQFLVQIFLHRLEDRSAAETRAHATDPEASLRNTVSLESRIARGQQVDVELESRDLAIDEPVQRFIWKGGPHGCSFVVSLPPDAAGRSFPIRARISIEAVPVGSLCFSIKATATSDIAGQALRIRGDWAKRYERAFLSYASPDRAEVLKRTETLSILGIGYFQDILSLEPGERWQRRLFEEIRKCDLFLLFWSSHAARSEWVIREAEFALNCKAVSAEDMPDIAPVVLEGPPLPPPPDSLKHLHFDSALRHLIAAVEREAPRSSPQAGSVS